LVVDLVVDLMWSRLWGGQSTNHVLWWLVPLRHEQGSGRATPDRQLQIGFEVFFGNGNRCRLEGGKGRSEMQLTK